MHHLGVHAVALGETGAEGQRPRGVDLRAEGGVDDHPPVAQLVAEPLHDDRAVVGDMAAGLLLLGEIAEHIGRRPVVQPGRGQPGPGVLRAERAELAQERAQGTAQFEGAAQLVALPEGRSRPGTPGAGVTSTRSRVMSSMRQDVVPSVKTSPTRDS